MDDEDKAMLREIRDLLVASGKRQEQAREHEEAYFAWVTRTTERGRDDAKWRFIFFLVYVLALFVGAVLIWG